MNRVIRSDLLHRWGILLAVAVAATAAAAPNLFLPGPPMLSREGRFGTVVLVGALHLALTAAVFCAVLRLRHRAAGFGNSAAVAGIIVAGGLLALWVDDAAFLTVATVCGGASPCAETAWARGIFYTVNRVVQPALPWSMLAPLVAGWAAWRARTAVP